MNRKSRLLCYPALLLASLMLWSCASAPPEPHVDFKGDYDFSSVKTIALKPSPRGVSGNSPRMLLSDIQINRIDSALYDAIEAKGFDMIDDPSKADALITWHLVAQEKTDVRTYNTGPSTGGYYGRYGAYNRRAYYNCWNCGGTEVSVRQYTEGTFIVDVIDPVLQQSVWRSVVQSKLKGDIAQDQTATNEAAARIVAAFPPR